MDVLNKVGLPSGAGRSHPARHNGARTSGTVWLEGVVEHGDARGRALGYPTANVWLPDGHIQDGVWAGTVQLGPDRTYAAAVSVGRRPTYYSQGSRLLEAHLLDYHGDLYGRTVLVSLHVYLRPQLQFHGTDELAAQIRDDVARVRHWAAGGGSGESRTQNQGADTAHSRRNHRSSGTQGSTRQRPLPAPPAAAAPASEGPTALDHARPHQHVDWNPLINALVEIRHNGRVVRTGVVDEVMPDSSALWIASDANGTRQMFEAAQGHQVWVMPQELPSGVRYRMTAAQIFNANATHASNS